MKTLKVKSILFSLLALMAVAIFTTSCQQEEVVINEIENSTELTDRLAENTNFQEIIKLLRQGEMSENFIELMSSYTIALGAEVPELTEMDKEAIEELMTTAALKLENTTVASRCQNGNLYYACALGAHATYVEAWYNCPPSGVDGGNCFSTLTNALHAAYARCFDWYC